jgi:hypothetical protein
VNLESNKKKGHLYAIRVFFYGTRGVVARFIKKSTSLINKKLKEHDPRGTGEATADSRPQTILEGLRNKKTKQKK